MNERTPNYKLRSSIYKALGVTSILTSTVGGFVVYESLINWENFQQEMSNFIIVSESSIKLNLLVALPFLVSFVVFIFVIMRKNRAYFSDKATLGLILGIIVVYLIYSVVEVVLFSMIGALGGTMIDEFILSPLSAKNRALAEDNHQLQLEEKKEKVRMKARKSSEQNGETYGSV